MNYIDFIASKVNYGKEATEQQFFQEVHSLLQALEDIVEQAK